MALGPLPSYPWDEIAPIRERAAQHPDGVIDLSIGSPVDETPKVLRDALAAAAEWHAYPMTVGTSDARDAVVEWFARRRGVSGLNKDEVLLTVGSKEFIAFAAFFLGLGEGDVIVQPSLAYPTYEMGARFAGATCVSEDDPAAWPENTKLVWLNSPGNPDGRVLGVDELRAAIARARELGAIVIGDECYAELGWGRWAEAVPSVLDPRVNGGSYEGILACSSLSKQSNVAGYRAAFVAGDGALVEQLVRARKHAGLIVPGPVQEVIAVALRDDAHVAEQRARYEARREVLVNALTAAGCVIDASEGGLYLWVTHGTSDMDTMRWLAELGIVAGPGHFYGAAGGRHVRISLTASDAEISRVAERLQGSGQDLTR